LLSLILERCCKIAISLIRPTTILARRVSEFIDAKFERESAQARNVSGQSRKLFLSENLIEQSIE
jgi:hypothetical protein